MEAVAGCRRRAVNASDAIVAAIDDVGRTPFAPPSRTAAADCPTPSMHPVVDSEPAEVSGRPQPLMSRSPKSEP